MFYDLHVNKVPFFVTIAAACTCVAASVWSVSVSGLQIGMLAAAAAAVALSCRTHVRIERTGMFLTLSEVLVFFWLLTFGTGAGTLIATAEAAVASLCFLRKWKIASRSPILLDASITAIATFGTGHVVQRVFGQSPNRLAIDGNGDLVGVLAVMLATQFAVKSFFWAAFASETKEAGFFRVWYYRCLNGLALYVIGALAAGLSIRAALTRDPALVLAAVFVGAVVFFTYRRYVNELKEQYTKVERSERTRAIEAKQHVRKLRQQIEKLERTESALRNSEARFRKAAYEDKLTGLGNQDLLMLEIEKARARRRKTGDFRFALLYLSLDRFASLNETLGHVVADQLLVSIADRLAASASPDDVLVRMTGGEFAILATDPNGQRDFQMAAGELVSRLSAPVTVEDKILFTSATVGIRHGEKDEQSADLLRDAKIAMYKARALDERSAVFNHEMYESVANRLKLEMELREAIERCEFVTYYQPIVDLPTMRLAGFEALVRWNHPERGLTGPGEFVGALEESGMITKVTTMMLHESCKKLAEWRSSLRAPDVFVSVNLSARDFSDGDLVARVRKALLDTGLPAECLKLEITESAIMDNAEQAASLLKDLKALGVKLSIDDFGTGYSSLSYLHKFPVDTLKVDRSFVSTMEFGSENGEIVRTVITLAKLLGMKIISEGIESLHQLHQLRILECEYGQGHLFSPPVPVDEAYRMMRDQGRWSGLAPAIISPPEVADRSAHSDHRSSPGTSY